MAVIADIIEGSTIQDTGGYSATRVFLVTGVTGAASAKLYNALNASGIPQIDEVHPSMSTIRCSSRNAEAASSDDNTTFRVTCQYTTPTYRSGGVDDPAQISIGSVAQDGQTTADKDGVDIILGPFDYTIGTPPQTKEAVKQTGLVSKMFPMPSVSFQRRLTSMDQLVGEAVAYVGKVNSAIFYLNKTGTVAVGIGSALCTRISGNSSDGGTTFDVTYDFQISQSSKGWKANVVYVNQETGLPHPDATEANGGKKEIDIYEEADFNDLDLVGWTP